MNRRLFALFALALLFAVAPLAAGAARVVTGTVVSLEDEGMRLRTTDGDLAFRFDPDLVLPTGFDIDAFVTVSYREDESGRIVTKVEDGMTLHTEGAPIAVADTAPATDRIVIHGSQASFETEAEAGFEAMPATASSLPLLALIGTTMLAAGVGLRAWQG